MANPTPNRRPANAWLSRLRDGNAIPLGSLLFLLVTFAFLPATRNGFINLDDTAYVTTNPYVQRGLTWAGLRWAFTTLHMGFWHPLTWLSIMLDCQFYGLQAWGHHLTSILLHAANTAVLFAVFRRLTGAPWPSAFVALLFGMHPLHVESVVWAAERKDVLSTFFFLLTLWAYARYVAEKSEFRSPKSEGKPKTEGSPKSEARSPKSEAIFHLPSSIFYLLALLFFALGLMSKTTVVTLPLLLLLLDYWPLRRFQLFLAAPPPSPLPPRPLPLALCLEKIPFFLLALVAAIVTIIAQRDIGAMMTADKLPVANRVANAVQACVQYLGQTLWPTRLAVYYPYPKGFWLSALVASFLLVLALTVFALWGARRRPYLAFGWFWYLVTLLPVIGLLQVGGQAHADRYTYVPLIGVFTLLAWGANDFTVGWRANRLKPELQTRKRAAGLAVAGAVVTGLCVAGTERQIVYWHDSETLFRRTLEVTQGNYFAHNNLGVALLAHQQVDEAILHFQEAVRLAPDFASAQANLGAALTKKGRLDEAIEHLREAIRLRPNFPMAYCTLGNALGRKGRLDEAISCLEEALRLQPDYPDAQQNLSYAQSLKAKAKPLDLQRK